MEGRIEAILRYAEIIDRRRNSPPTEADGYAEEHHAMPRKLPAKLFESEAVRDRVLARIEHPENLVVLPVREHIEAHVELARAIGDQAWGRGMAHSALLMTHGRQGEFATIENAAEARELAAMARRGVPRSDAAREAMSKGMRGRPKSPRTQEHCLALSRAMTGRTHSTKTREKLSAANKGKVRSDEHKRAIGDASRGVKSHNYNPELLVFEHTATGKRFELTRLGAHMELGIPRTKVSALIAGRRPSSNGYRIIRQPSLATSEA